MKRPALFVTTALISSIIITKNLGIVFTLIFLSALSVYFLFVKKSFKTLIILTLIICIISSLHTSYKINKKSTFYEYPNINIEFSAIVTEPAKEKSDYTEYVVKIIDSPFNASGEKILLRVYESNKTFKCGEVYNINAKISIPSAKRNPGGFDYAFYLKGRGLYAIAKCDYADTAYIGKTHLPFYMDYVYSLRDIIINTLYDNLPNDNAGLISGILFGTNDLDDKTLNNFRLSGVAHILAVSGLHVSTVCYITNFVLSKTKLNRKLKYFINVIFPYFYLMLANFGVSILRACIMNTVSTTARELKKQTDLFNSICIAALISLIINPLYLYNVSFLLSYSCVLSIALFSEFISHKLKKIKSGKIIKYIINFIGFNISVNLLMIPISLYYFNNLSTLSAIANFFIVPTLTVIMFLCISALITTPIFPFIAKVLYKILNIVLIYIKTVPKILTSISFSSVNIPTPHLYLIILYYLFLMICFGYLSLKNTAHIKIIISVIICVVLIFSFTLYEYSGNKIYFLDVGQGDCAFIHAYGETILIDTGKSYNLENVIIPFLYEIGVNKIDKVVITHADSDHSGCISELMDKIEIGAIYFNECDSNVYREVKAKAKNYNIKFRSVYAGDRVNEWIKVISPMRSYNHSNNDSIALDVNINGNSILFLADIETEAIQDLIDYGNLNKCEIVKCMHHGASYSNSEELYSILSPKCAIISTGTNSYGLPHEITYNTLYKLNTRIYRTDDFGCVIADFNKSGYKIKTFITY